MSFDLYLLPLQHEDDFDSAMSFFAALDGNDPDYAYELDARDAAKTILELDPRYATLQISAADQDRFNKTAAGKAYLESLCNSVQLTGHAEDGQPLAQFQFHRYHIVIHSYSGTSADELDRYVIALCAATGLAVVDPQRREIWRLQQNGTLA